MYDTNYIYVGDDEIFFSPDSIGRIFFDSLEEAKAETGLTKVITF